MRLPVGLTSLVKKDTTKSLPQGLFVGRIVDIILDDQTHPEIFKNYGEWGGIGTIFFSPIEVYKNLKIDDNAFARPLFPNVKNYPLKNEIVYLFAFPNNQLEENTLSMSYFYFQPLNLWNSVHHNAIPYIIDSVGDSSQTRDYEQTQAGAVRKVQDSSTEIDLGNTFHEKLDIRNLLPFEGDTIYEGRWGQSLRFGSTVVNSNIPNNWSVTGSNGDPITILRNGQHEEDTEAWVPQLEDINKDKSSIYLTSQQIIPLNASSTNYSSYTNPPANPKEYSGDQVILNSGRLVFNSKDDDILLSGKNSINLNSLNSVNIDTTDTIINSENVLLGGKNAKESVILGDSFLDDFQQLLIQITLLGEAMISTPVGTPSPGVPHPVLGILAPSLRSRAQRMLNKIENYKSTTSKSL